MILAISDSDCASATEYSFSPPLNMPRRKTYAQSETSRPRTCCDADHCKVLRIASVSAEGLKPSTIDSMSRQRR